MYENDIFWMKNYSTEYLTNVESLIQHDAGYVTIAENAPGLSAEEEVRVEIH